MGWGGGLRGGGKAGGAGLQSAPAAMTRASRGQAPRQMLAAPRWARRLCATCAPRRAPLTLMMGFSLEGTGHPAHATRAHATRAHHNLGNKSTGRGAPRRAPPHLDDGLLLGGDAVQQAGGREPGGEGGADWGGVKPKATSQFSLVEPLLAAWRRTKMQSPPRSARPFLNAPHRRASSPPVTAAHYQRPSSPPPRGRCHAHLNLSVAASSS